MLEYNPNLLKAVLLLTIAVSGNFIGSTLSCKTQYYMTNNVYIKHLIILFIIYFTLSYTSDDTNPLNFMKNSLLIWLCYLLFTKQNIVFTGVSALLLFSTYIIDSFVSHYNEKISNEKNEEEKQSLEKKIKVIKTTRTVSFYLGIATIIIGFFIYIYEKYVEYGKDFTPLTFILGKVTCKSLE